VPEADDHGAGVEVAERFEQQVDALVVEELPEVDDRRLVGPEEGSEAFGVALVGEALISGVVAASLLDERRERLVTRLGPELVHVYSGRDLVHAIDVADHLLEHLADVLAADADGLRPRKRLLRPRGELLV